MAVGVVRADPLGDALGAAPRVQALRAQNARERAEAAWWLYAHAPSEAAPRHDVRAELRVVIAHERDPAAAVAEVTALARLTRGTHERSVRMLEVLGNGMVPEVAQRVALRALTAELTEDLLPDLLARVASAGSLESPLTPIAALGLAALPTPLVSAALQQTASNPSRRATVLRAIGLRGDPRWSFAVVEALDGPRGVIHESVVAAALEAAAALRLVEAAPRVVAVVEDERAVSLRPRALRALARLGGGFDPAVIARAMTPPLTRVAALEAAAALGDPSLAAPCAEHLGATFGRDRAAAVRCVSALSPGAFRARLQAASSREDDPAVLDALDDALSPPGEPSDPRETLALSRELAGAAPAWVRVRAAAALALRASNDEPARDALLALARREQDLPSTVALAALSGVVRAGAAPEDPVLLRWLAGEDPVARQCAAHAVGVTGGHASRAALRAWALREVDDDARRAAAVALGRAEGASAEATLSSLDESAFTPEQVEAVAHGRRLAREARPSRAAYRASMSLRRRGFVPFSVWSATLPDGGLAVGSADGDGVLLIPGAGDAAVLRRLDVR